jgi:hypothetical protein
VNGNRGKKMLKYKYFVFAHPEDKGRHYNSIPTVLHNSAITAGHEAERLAAQEPSIRFCVGVIYKHYVNVPVTKINEVDYGYSDLR